MAEDFPTRVIGLPEALFGVFAREQVRAIQECDIDYRLEDANCGSKAVFR